MSYNFKQSSLTNNYRFAWIVSGVYGKFLIINMFGIVLFCIYFDESNYHKGLSRSGEEQWSGTNVIKRAVHIYCSASLLISGDTF